MKNTAGEIIYVGKAKNLKNRVRSYFRSHNHPPKVRSMVENVDIFEYIITDSELEALVLENNLIKENMPKYNILLKDDKTYPFLKITVKELYPRIIFTRRVTKDGSLYFGPYQSSADLKKLIMLLKEIYCLRSCNTEFDSENLNRRPCLYYQLGKCPGICAGYISPDDYRALIKKAVDFINGDTHDAEQSLYRQMREAADTLDFEKAAICRDRLEAVELIKQKQKIVNPNGNDSDAIGLYNANGFACIQLFFIRGGSIIGREHYFIENTEDVPERDILAQFLKIYYEDCSFIPQTVYLQYELEEQELLADFISSKATRKVTLKTPKIGDNVKLINMIVSNAKKEHSEKRLKAMRDIDFKNNALSELTTLLKLENAPMNMEAYDISNMGNNTSVGSMVVYCEGKPCTKRYRNFRMKTVDVQDDYASMKEMIQRRFSRADAEMEKLENGQINLENCKFLPMPDVIFIDGGEGHRNAALEVIGKYGIPVFGIVKDNNHKTRALVGSDGEIKFGDNKDAFLLVVAIQDEMHRRAITYLRNSEKSKTKVSELDLIPGVGDKRKKSLLTHFKSIKNIKNASVEELSKAKGMDIKTAGRVFEYFNSHKQENTEEQ